MVKIFTGSFKKKNNDIRTMTFVKLEDLPSSFLSSKIKDGSSQRKVPEGQELVWDVSESAFRTFNWNSALGEVDVKLLEGKEKENFEKKHLT